MIQTRQFDKLYSQDTIFILQYTGTYTETASAENLFLNTSHLTKHPSLYFTGGVKYKQNY